MFVKIFDININYNRDKVAQIQLRLGFALTQKFKLEKTTIKTISTSYLLNSNKKD